MTFAVIGRAYEPGRARYARRLDIALGTNGIVAFGANSKLNRGLAARPPTGAGQDSVAAVVGVVVPSVDRSIPGPVGASALDSRARESPALVLGGRLGRGLRGHGLVVHQLDTRGRRDVPHVRVSDSTCAEHFFGGNGPEGGRDGRHDKRCSAHALPGRKLFRNPTPQSVA